MSDSQSLHDLGRIVGKDFHQILHNFNTQLIAHEADINALNVFPVPDADTGTNSLVTVQAGMMGLASAPLVQDSLQELVRTFAQYASANARGNSGTILAEYFRGLSLALGDVADVATWRAGLQSAHECATGAVLRPCEGTMLSIASAVAKVSAPYELSAYLGDITHVAKLALLKTTQQLAELRDAQVVDAGACVLVLFHEAVSSFYNNHEINISFVHEGTCIQADTQYEGPELELTFLLTTSRDVRDSLRDALATLGESLTIAGSTPEFKVHIHTDHVDDVITAVQSLGSVSMITTSSLSEFVTKQ